MAHEIEFVNGQAAIVYVGETPWHGLGVEIPDNLSPVEVMEAAGIDWTVDKLPMYIDIDGQKVPVGKNALVRSSDNSVLDVVSDSWNPVQNAEAFEFFDRFIESGQMKMHTAGSLREGRVVWALAKVDQSFAINGSDEVESYLLFSNPHMFGRCVDIRFTPTRVVCNNTLSYALREQTADSVRHSHRTVFDGETVYNTMALASEKMQKYKEMAEFLASKRYSDQQLISFANDIFPVLTTNRVASKPLSKQAERMIEIIDTQPGAAYAPGTWWNAVNAVTYITNHEYGKTSDARLNSLWFGPNAQRNGKAMTWAMDYANAA